MKRVLLFTTLFASLLLARSAPAADFSVFPLKASFIVRMVVVDFSMDFDSIAEVKLGEKDVVNLALGRPLDQKVDPKTEILAIATAFEGSSGSPVSKVIVFDPTASGPARIKATVARATMLAIESGSVEGGVEGQGTGTADVLDVGDAEGGFDPSSIFLTGAGKTTPGVPPGPDGKISWKGSIAGRINLTKTEKGETTSLQGFIVNGKVSASGRAIGQFSE